MEKSNEVATTTKSLFAREDVKTKFSELLGKRSASFITSVLSAVNQSTLLKNAKPESVYMSAMMAATLDLPINPNLGFAYIIPYNHKDEGQLAQFQMGVKGFVQLALRSGQFKTISAAEIYEGQLISENPLTGYIFDFTKKTSDKIIGYASFFSLLNGFEKTFYMTVDQIHAHGKKYSKSYNNKYGLWQTDFHSMATKTVIKLLLSKYAPLSVEMQKAVIADQGIIKDVETMDVDYIDEGKAVEVVDLDDLKELYKQKAGALTPEESANAERILDNKEEASYAKLQTLLKSK